MDKTEQLELSFVVENFDTFAEILDNTSKFAPEKIFLIEGEEHWTYKGFNKLVDRCCYFLGDLGIKPKDTISVVLRNSIDYLIIYFAALRCHIILNPFPYHMSGNEVLSKAEMITPKAIFCHKDFLRLAIFCE